MTKSDTVICENKHGKIYRVPLWKFGLVVFVIMTIGLAAAFSFLDVAEDYISAALDFIETIMFK